MTATLTVNEETQELQRDASILAYTAIRFSGLYRELTSDEWEALADKLGALAVGLIQSEINAELTRREAESRKLDEWLSTRPQHDRQLEEADEQWERLLEALRGVRLMLRTELKAYQSEPWAQRVNEAYDATIEREELTEELRKALFDVELMIEVNQVTDGPRNDKERTEQAERHALVGRLIKIRRALYRSKELIEHLEN